MLVIMIKYAWWLTCLRTNVRYFVPTLVSILVKLLIDFRIYKPLLRYPFFVVPLNMSDAVKITRSRTVKRKVASFGIDEVF